MEMIKILIIFYDNDIIDCVFIFKEIEKYDF